jgi:HEAT repeat protein
MKLGDPEHRRALHLLDLIQHHPTERRHAMSLLAQIRNIPFEAIPVLTKALHDSDWGVRRNAAEALKKTRPAAIPVLIEALHDANPKTRRNAAEALGLFGRKAFATTGPALAGALCDDDRDVRQIAVEVIEALMAAGAFLPVLTEAIPVLTEALHHCDGDVRRVAVKAIKALVAAGAIPASKTVSILIEALRHSDWDLRRIARVAAEAIPVTEAIPFFIEALHHSDSWDLHPIAFEALVRAGPAAIPILSEALHTRKKVRRDAARALGQIGREAIPVLIEALQDADREVRGISAVVLREQMLTRNVAISVVAKALADADWEALPGRIGSAATEALLALTDALHDTNRTMMRRNAAVALWQIANE